MKILTTLAPIATIINVIYTFWKDLFKKNKNDNNKMSNSINNNTIGGNNIINQGSGNNVNIHNGDNNFSAASHIDCIVNEEQRVPIIFKGLHIEEFWLDAVALFTLLILILLVFFHSLLSQNYSLAISLGYLFAMAVSFALFGHFFYCSSKIRNIPILNTLFWGLTASHAGKLYKVKYSGTCLHCGGKIEVKIIQGKPKAQCQIYKQTHVFDFTPRIFDKENYSS